MFRQAKHGWTALGRVTANTFKNARTVMNSVRHHVNASVIPIDQLAVAPNFRRNSQSGDIFC
jgi:hypothetical protein